MSKGRVIGRGRGKGRSRHATNVKKMDGQGKKGAGEKMVGSDALYVGLPVVDAGHLKT